MWQMLVDKRDKKETTTKEGDKKEDSPRDLQGNGRELNDSALGFTSDFQ